MTGGIPEQLAGAIEQFRHHERQRDASRIVPALATGLAQLRDLFYQRLHFDVEKQVGADSMFLPLSEIKTHRQCNIELDLYHVAESAWAAGQFGYVNSPEQWYLSWLGELRLEKSWAEANVAARLRDYQALAPDLRRRRFMDRLLDVLPESGRAPLVLFRLAPLAVHLATALAFGDRARALEVRQQQLVYLPAIADCQRCRGAVQDTGATCTLCGNPLWTYEWLNVTD